MLAVLERSLFTNEIMQKDRPHTRLYWAMLQKKTSIIVYQVPQAQLVLNVDKPQLQKPARMNIRSPSPKTIPDRAIVDKSNINKSLRRPSIKLWSESLETMVKERAHLFQQ